jgi:hypothetical protein
MLVKEEEASSSDDDEEDEEEEEPGEYEAEPENEAVADYEGDVKEEGEDEVADETEHSASSSRPQVNKIIERLNLKVSIWTCCSGPLCCKVYSEGPPAVGQWTRLSGCSF